MYHIMVIDVYFLPFLSSMSGNTVQLAVFGLSLPVGCSGANGLSPGAGGYLRKGIGMSKKNTLQYGLYVMLLCFVKLS